MALLFSGLLWGASETFAHYLWSIKLTRSKQVRLLSYLGAKFCIGILHIVATILFVILTSISSCDYHLNDQTYSSCPGTQTAVSIFFYIAFLLSSAYVALLRLDEAHVHHRESFDLDLAMKQRRPRFSSRGSAAPEPLRPVPEEDYDDEDCRRDSTNTDGDRYNDRTGGGSDLEDPPRALGRSGSTSSSSGLIAAPTAPRSTLSERRGFSLDIARPPSMDNGPSSVDSPTLMVPTTTPSSAGANRLPLRRNVSAASGGTTSEDEGGCDPRPPRRKLTMESNGKFVMRDNSSSTTTTGGGPSGSASSPVRERSGSVARPHTPQEPSAPSMDITQGAKMGHSRKLSADPKDFPQGRRSTIDLGFPFLPPKDAGDH